MPYTRREILQIMAASAAACGVPAAIAGALEESSCMDAVGAISQAEGAGQHILAMKSAFEMLNEALHADPMYAWTWHCNLSMTILDRLGLTYPEANQAGAAIMDRFFHIDIKKNPFWADGAHGRMTRIETLENVVDIQSSPGNFNYSPYMHGLGNGLILALSIMRDSECKYLENPKVWLCDNQTRGDNNEQKSIPGSGGVAPDRDASRTT